MVLPRGFAHPCIPPRRHRGGVGRTVYVRVVQLTRSRIIAMAIELIEADGVEAVSMHRLATELGCSVMSLYHYVPSKSALLDGIAEQVMSAVEVTPMPRMGGAARLQAQARAFRKIAMTYPRCAMVAVSRRPASPRSVRPAEAALAALREAGFEGQEAVRILRAVLAYTTGSLIAQDPEADFEFGLELLVHAVAAHAPRADACLGP
jgi:AcrR family transcriptional regulator